MPALNRGPRLGGDGAMTTVSAVCPHDELSRTRALRAGANSRNLRGRPRTDLAGCGSGSLALPANSAAACGEDRVDNLLHANPIFRLCEHEGTYAAHGTRVARHDVEACPYVRRKVGLVDDEKIRLRDARASLARHFVTTGHVDHVDREVDQLSTELSREVVAAAFDDQELRSDLPHELIERVDVVADVLADRGVRTTSGFDGAYALRRESVMAVEKLGVFTREDIVCHDAEPHFAAQRAAERIDQSRLTAADRAADADGKGALRIVPAYGRFSVAARPGRRPAIVVMGGRTVVVVTVSVSFVFVCHASPQL